MYSDIEVPMNERTKERLKFNLEIVRLCVVALLTTGGGIISLVIEGSINGTKSFFISMGFLFSVGVLSTLVNTIRKTNRELNE